MQQSNAYSLAFYKFKKNIEIEIRTYWGLATIKEFSSQYLKNIPNQSIVTIGGNKPPFTYVDIPKNQFLTESNRFIENARENTLVNIVTTFEVYLNDILSRIIFLYPHLVIGNNTTWTTDQIAPRLNNNFQKWFADTLTTKLIRNQQHYKTISFIAKIIKWDIKPINSLIEQWHTFTLIRNSIAHNGRRTTQELCQNAPSRFSRPGTPLQLTRGEIMLANKIALKIAKYLDHVIMAKYIQQHDALLLVREIFIRTGIENTSTLKTIINKNLHQKLTNPDVQKALTYQKTHTQQPTNEFDFDQIYNFIDLS